MSDFVLVVQGIPGVVLITPAAQGPPGVGGDGSGMSQAAADARYVRQSQINAAGGVAGLDSGSAVLESALPLPPVDLAILVANQLA